MQTRSYYSRKSYFICISLQSKLIEWGETAKPPRLPSFQVIDEQQDELDDREAYLIQRMEEEPVAREEFFAEENQLFR